MMKMTDSKGWNWRRGGRLVLAATLLVVVYLAVGNLPVGFDGMPVEAITGFVLFWVLGGLFTITLMAFIDRKA